MAGFAIVLGWALYTAFSASQSIFLNKAGPHAYPLFFIVLALTVWPVVAAPGARFRLRSAPALRLTVSTLTVPQLDALAAAVADALHPADSGHGR